MSDYTERLWPPPLYWLAATGVVGTVGWVLAVSTPTLVVVVGTAVAAVLAVAGLVAVGSVEVGVRGGELVAGRAHVPLSMCGAVRALDASAARRARGVEADARAHLVIRPYVPCCVRADIDDPADPTPYWLVSARRPELVAAAAATGVSGPRPAEYGTMSAMARKKKSESPIQDAQAAGAQPSSGAGSKQLWKVYSKGATILSGVLTIQLAQKLWRAATRKEPPNSPEHPEIDVREAIMWALLSGAVAELVKVAVSRKTAQYWVRSTGNLPPDMDPIEK